MQYYKVELNHKFNLEFAFVIIFLIHIGGDYYIITFSIWIRPSHGQWPSYPFRALISAIFSWRPAGELGLAHSCHVTSILRVWLVQRQPHRAGAGLPQPRGGCQRGVAGRLPVGPHRGRPQQLHPGQGVTSHNGYMGWSWSGVKSGSQPSLEKKSKIYSCL